MEAKSTDLERLSDIFDSSLRLEETHLQEGFNEGYKDGLASGVEEGRLVGLKHGFVIGEELGFYRGCVNVWQSVIQADLNAFSERVKKGVHQMAELIERYPIMEPEDESLQNLMDAMRSRFRVVTTGMGVRVSYDGYLKEEKGLSEMMKSLLACCKLYISESRNALALELIEKALKPYGPQAVLVNKFVDDAYNRVGYTVVSTIPPNTPVDAGPLRKAVFDMVNMAFKEINLEFHSGSHPRLGVIDHICFHPLAQASLDQAAKIARSVAADIGNKLQVPTFLYGAAHDERKTLDSIRRDLGYFKPNASDNQWVGGLGFEQLPLMPNEGPSSVPRDKGVVVIGSTKWVDNYNVPVLSTNIAAVKRITRKVSGRGGGLESVQAMALAHGEGSTEVACNLLEPDKVGAGQVQLSVEQLAAQEGLTVGNGYFTDFPEGKILEEYMKLQGTKL